MMQPLALAAIYGSHRLAASGSGCDLGFLPRRSKGAALPAAAARGLTLRKTVGNGLMRAYSSRQGEGFFLTSEQPDSLRNVLPRVGNDISLRKLQIFWSVAHTGSLTRAAKLLSLSQPTVSQQIAALEAAVGNKLFERVNSSVIATEFGLAFIRYAEAVLRSAQELEDMVSEYGKGQMQTVRVAGVPSALRAILPKAMLDLRRSQRIMDFDMHEAGPAEVLEMLYARRINLALLGSNTIGELAPGFAEIPLTDDPYVLVVPEALELDQITDPEQELSPPLLAQLRATIQFAFGNAHSRRLQDWFDLVIPANRVVARARSFELVVEMVRTGLGICVAPALSALPNAMALQGVRLHHLSLAPRRIMAIVPNHYQRQEPYVSLLAALRDSARALPPLTVAPEPPFVRQRAGPPRPEGSAQSRALLPPLQDE